VERAIAAARVLLGATFLVFGANYFLGFIPFPEPAPRVAELQGLLRDLRMYPVFKLAEVLAGALLVLGRAVPFALLLLAPIVVNIVLFHAFLEPRGWPLGALVTALELLLAWAYWPSFRPLFARGAARASRVAGSAGPRFYAELAAWWPLFSAPADYAEEAAFHERLLVGACEPPAQTLLELGSGGGNNASYLKARFRTTLVDRSPGMLEVSRGLNPECEHVLGDMRSVRLGREFDCVFVHDAISYLTTEEDLRSALETAWVHCRPGGAALFAPDHVRETFGPSTGHGGHDGDGRALRYLEWSWDPDPGDGTFVADYAFLLREPDGSTRVEGDRHVQGLFPRGLWLRLLADVGFDAKSVPFEHSELEPGKYEVFVARRPR